jgi:beta-phosphoglucomutase
METGYIFDLDGVITDTVSHHYSSWKKLAAELGISFSEEANEELRGRSRRDALSLFLGNRSYSEAQLQQLLERKNALFLESVRDFGPADLLPGVHDLLLEARAAGIRLGVGSASRNARGICRKLGILDLLDALGDGSSVSNPKPAPDIFLWVAGRLGLPPARCIVFEDAEAGVTAALAGGFRTVGLGPAWRVGKAHLVRGSLEAARVADFGFAAVEHAR